MQSQVNNLSPKTKSLSLEIDEKKYQMTSTLFKVKCEKGHRANALIWDEETIQNYIESKKCNSCGSLIHRLSD